MAFNNILRTTADHEHEQNNSDTRRCMGYQHRQHPCFPTSCHLQRRHHRQQTANRFKWSRCWEVAVLTMLVTHTPVGADLSCTWPIDRPCVDVPISRLFCSCSLSSQPCDAYLMPGRRFPGITG